MKNKFSLIIILIVIVIIAIVGFYFFNNNRDKTSKDSELFTDPRYSVESTGLDLIEAALNEGKIDLEIALIYKVKFLFNDPTLPKEYFTENSVFEDNGVFAEIQENWDNLSEQSKKELEPYFLRPDNPESYISKKLNDEIQASENNSFGLIQKIRAYDRPISYKSDDALNTFDGKIKVWYLEKKEVVNNEEKITKIYYDVAQKIVNNLNTDKAYSKFYGLLGKAPPSDGILGGDNRTDIYIAPGSYSLLVDGEGSSYGVNVPDNGNGNSSFVVLRDNLDDKNLKTTTVHELFHAFQRAFDCKLYKVNWWWIEGTATWSEDFIYPKEDTEQGHVINFIPKPETSLNKNGNNFEYGAYVFPFYLSKTYNDNIIADIFKGCTISGDPLNSTEKNIDGGFKKNWKEFTLWNYNKKPVENYKNSDQSKKFPEDSSSLGGNTETNFIGTLGETPYSIQALAPLTAQVISFPVMEQGEDVRKITFKDLKNFIDKTDKTGIKAIIYPKSGDPYVEDWTDKQERSFCLDKTDEDIKEVYLIFSNGELKTKIDQSSIKIRSTESCFEINQEETMVIQPLFALSSSYTGTLKYKAEGSLEKKSVPKEAKYPYLGKWKVNVNYLEMFPPQGLPGISATKMDFFYNHILEFDLSIVKDGVFEIKTSKGNFQTSGWEVHNEITGEVYIVPEGEMDWSVPQKGIISEITESGCKISLPDFILYNSGAYRNLPHSIILEIKK